ncbi:hypothetical protein BH23ACT2_BH23ACT2_28640 [soil metagenome]
MGALRSDAVGDPMALVRDLTGVLDAQGDVVAGYLFGSYGRGTAGEHSDVDVAVLFEAAPTLDHRLTVRAELAAMVAPRRLDLVVLDDAPVALAYRVLRDGILLVGTDDGRRIRHAATVMDLYFDMAPMRRTLATGVANRLREERFGRA